MRGQSKVPLPPRRCWKARCKCSPFTIYHTSLEASVSSQQSWIAFYFFFKKGAIRSLFLKFSGAGPEVCLSLSEAHFYRMTATHKKSLEVKVILTKSQLLTASWPATPWATGWSGRAAACRLDPAASQSWAASARSGPSSSCSRSSTPCCGVSPCREWSCNWLSRSVDGRERTVGEHKGRTDGFLV